MSNMNLDDKRQQSFPLRLSPSLRQQAIEFAHGEGISLNHFIGMAIVEKISRMDIAYEEEERKQRDAKPALSVVRNQNNGQG